MGPQMAAEGDITDAPVSSLTQEALDASLQNSLLHLKNELLNDMARLLKPLTERLDEIQVLLQQVAQTAGTALEASIASQDDIRRLRYHEEWATDSLLYHQNQLKIRGFSEEEEGETPLLSFLKSWLCSVLKVSDDAILSTAKYWLENPNNPSLKGPRDIIAVHRVMNKIRYQ